TGEDTRAVAHVLHVATGAECTAITGQHHYPRGAVAAQLGTEIDELLDLLGGCQCIAGFGMVHANGDDAAIPLGLQECTHSGFSAGVDSDWLAWPVISGQ